MATILVVDDEDDIRYLVEVNLSLDGHKVLTAANGDEALDLVSRERPDAIVLDIMMPDKSGYQVLAELKANPNLDTQTIPVVMLTALGAEPNRLRGGIEGALHYLTKPIDPEELRQAVADALAAEDEPTRRREVQTDSLTKLARMETGSPPRADEPSPRLARLERIRRDSTEAVRKDGYADKVAELTPKQRRLLRVLAEAPTVSAGADTLGVSRSNVYASLRRITRKLGTGTVPQLLEVVRRGELPLGDDSNGD